MLKKAMKRGAKYLNRGVIQRIEVRETRVKMKMKRWMKLREKEGGKKCL